MAALRHRYLDLAGMEALRHVRLRPRGEAEGTFAGPHKSHFRGTAVEFADYREYAPGDEIRSIDWNVKDGLEEFQGQVTQFLEKIKPILENPAIKKVGQNFKYDQHVLANHGITLRGIAHDTMLESYVLNSTATKHNMDDIAKKYLDVTTIHYEDVAGKGAKQIPFSQVDIETVPGAADRLVAETGKRAIPFILVNGRTWVRGYHRELAQRFDPDTLVRELRLAAGL